MVMNWWIYFLESCDNYLFSISVSFCTIFLDMFDFFVHLLIANFFGGSVM